MYILHTFSKQLSIMRTMRIMLILKIEFLSKIFRIDIDDTSETSPHHTLDCTYVCARNMFKRHVSWERMVLLRIGNPKLSPGHRSPPRWCYFEIIQWLIELPCTFRTLLLVIYLECVPRLPSGSSIKGYPSVSRLVCNGSFYTFPTSSFSTSSLQKYL